MEQSNNIEFKEEIAEIERYVRMEHVLIELEQLKDRMEIVLPSRLKNRHNDPPKPKNERILVLLPSPFRASDDDFNSVVVYLENNEWDDFTGRKPKNIPNTPVGFVMAYDGCTYREALQKLYPLALFIKSRDQQDLERYLAGIRNSMEIRAVLSAIREKMRIKLVN
jgi:hypothetical protein